MFAAYLAGAVVVDAILVPGLLDPFRDALDEFLYLLQLREEISAVSEILKRLINIHQNKKFDHIVC